MATDHFNFKRHEGSERQKYMEHNFACTLGGHESIMKFSTQRLESPPPKPPRRRYSDQLIVTSSGAYPSSKKSDDNPRSDSKPKRCILKPTYLSLPANLASDVQTEYNDTSNLCSCPDSLSDQLKHSKENGCYAKTFFRNLNVCESTRKQSYGSGRFSNKETLQSVIPGVNKDLIFSNYQHENNASGIVDKLSRSLTNSSKISMTNAYINQNLKSFHKECHRRHHSDPIISHCNLHNDNSIKISFEQCCDNTSYSSKKDNKCFDSAAACCKTNHFILQEKRILKEINDKLWQRVCSLQTSLENTREKDDKSVDVSVSDLLSSIYYAQKTKDSAMEERLKLMQEERDAVVRELEGLIHILSKHFGCTVGEKEDKDIKELLEDLESITNPLKFLKYQRMLLSHIHNIKETKQSQLSHKLKQTVIERNNALEKVKTLEDEVEEMKFCYDLWHSDSKRWEFTMFDIINQVMHQRDILLSKVDNGFDIGNVISRPLAINKLDSLEHQSALHHESQSKAVESLQKHQFMHSNDKQQHSVSSSEDIEELKEEISVLNRALECERKKRQHTEEKCFRLERLIHILRKKLNGQDIGVPV